MEKPDWWDANPSLWLKAVMKNYFISRLTITSEEQLMAELNAGNSVIKEIRTDKKLTSTWLYVIPVWLYPHRVYIRLSLFRRLVDEGKLTAYHTEDTEKSVLFFYTKSKP